MSFGTCNYSRGAWDSNCVYEALAESVALTDIEVGLAVGNTTHSGVVTLADSNTEVMFGNALETVAVTLDDPLATTAIQFVTVVDVWLLSDSMVRDGPVQQIWDERDEGTDNTWGARAEESSLWTSRATLPSTWDDVEEG